MKFFTVLFLVLLHVSLYSTDMSFVERKYNALAIGQITLSYRLLSLSAGLAVAKATDPSDIVSLLDNVDATLSNAQDFLSTDAVSPSPTSNRVNELIKELISCSSFVKHYALNKDLDSLEGMNRCVDALENEIVTVSEEFNKASITTKKPLQKEGK